MDAHTHTAFVALSEELGGTLTMTTHEIADLCGARHNDLRTTVERQFARGVLRESRKTLRPYAPSGGGRPTHVYDLTKRDTLVVVSGYNDHVRARIIDRWIELERASADGSLTGVEASAIRKELAELKATLTELVITHDNRRAAVTHVSVKALLDEAGALPKGRNSVNRKIGRALKDRALAVTGRGEPAPHLKDANLGVWIFDRHFADRYMREKGDELVAMHNDKVSGQGVIRFPDRRRSSADKPAPAAL